MTEQRGYYAIVSRMHGLALDIEGASTHPGAHVIPWEKHLNDNQLWYDDPINGTIRSRLNSFCLDIEGDRLQVKPYQPGDANQLWFRDSDGYIRNRRESSKVIDIFGKRTEPGAPVGVYDENGGTNQQWDFLFVGGPAPPEHKRCFYIVSEMNHKVLDIKEGSSEPRSKVVTWSKSESPTPSQLWYTDFTGCIHSALTGFVFEAEETGKAIKMVPPVVGNIKQFWTLAENKKIWNKDGTGECMDIAKEKNDNGAKVISYHYKGSSNQQWSFEYV